jgi:hypothetical protein
MLLECTCCLRWSSSPGPHRWPCVAPPPPRAAAPPAQLPRVHCACACVHAPRLHRALHRACTVHAPRMHRQCTTHHACAMHVLSGPARCACARAHTPRPPPHIAAARRPAASRAPSWRPPARHAPGAAAATCHAQGSDASCSWFMCRVLRGHLHTRHMGHGHGHGHGHGTWDMDMGTDRPARGPLLTLHGAHRMLCRIPRAVAYTTALGDDRGGVLGVVGCRGYPQLRGRSVATRGGGVLWVYRGLCCALLPQRAELRHRAARRLLLTRGQCLGARRAVGGLLGRGGQLRVLMRCLLWSRLGLRVGVGLRVGPRVEVRLRRRLCQLLLELRARVRVGVRVRVPVKAPVPAAPRACAP